VGQDVGYQPVHRTGGARRSGGGDEPGADGVGVVSVFELGVAEVDGLAARAGQVQP